MAPKKRVGTRKRVAKRVVKRANKGVRIMMGNPIAPRARRRSTAMKLPSRGCHLKRTADCFSFDAIDKTVEQIGMTPEQIKTFGLTPGQHVLWCSECETVYLLNGTHARIIGHVTTPGARFKPGDPKESVWLGAQ